MMYPYDHVRRSTNLDEREPVIQVFDGATCRAARALLGVSQEELCSDAGCGRQLLAEFENDVSLPKEAKVADLKAALEARGAVFGRIGDMMLVGARREEIGRRSARARTFARRSIADPG